MKAKYPEYKGLNLPNIATAVLEKWQKEAIFEQSVAQRAGAPSFVFYEGPPSANGLPGIHHVMGRAIKDIFCRYQTLKGKQVHRKAGWDTHGLPVELGVEKELGITKEETMAFGDYNNDLKMLALADFSYAMDNAHPNVISVSNFKTKSNDEFGVELVLEQLINSRKI